MQAEAEAESVRVSSEVALGLWSEWGLLLELGFLVLNYSHQYHSFLYHSQMRGEAEAFAIGARAQAEAEQMAKKAEAFQLYQEAAQLDMLLEKLPQVWRLCGHQERNRTRECRVGGNEGLGETQAGGLEIWGGNYKPVTEVRKDDPYKVKKITILKPRVRCFRRGVVRPQVLSGPLSPTRWQRRSVVP